MEETKPFKISKQAVKIAFDRVKANKGTYGIDDQTISDFEENLKDNLYKIWNRMSSGTYFPKPVKSVAIPKKNGGTRILGIPTVEDRRCPYPQAEKARQGSYLDISLRHLLIVIIPLPRRIW